MRASSAQTHEGGQIDNGDVTFRGSCFCGKVAFQVDGPKVFGSICHCTICQRLHGAPWVAMVFFPSDKFRVTSGDGFIGSFRTSEKLIRHHCNVCASRLHNDYVSKGVSLVEIPLAILERNVEGKMVNSEGLRPDWHEFYPNRMAEVMDDLPKYDGLAPPFQ